MTRPKVFTFVEETYSEPAAVPDRVRAHLRMLWLNGAKVTELAKTLPRLLFGPHFTANPPRQSGCHQAETAAQRSSHSGAHNGQEVRLRLRSQPAR